MEFALSLKVMHAFSGNSDRARPETRANTLKPPVPKQKTTNGLKTHKFKTPSLCSRLIDAEKLAVFGVEGFGLRI